MEHSNSGVGVLDKAVALLEACVGGASLAMLAERTELPRATAHRIAAALEHHRLLTKDHEGRWHPGPRLVELSRSSLDPLVAAASPVLAHLRDHTGESAQLFVRRGKERICVCVAERASGLRDTIPVGAALPMTAGSAAQVLLAFDTHAMTEFANSKFSARTLAEVRRRGWAQSVAEREAGVASVSAPVRNEVGAVVAAVSISGPIERLTRRPGERHARAVARAAAELSGSR